MDTMCSIGICRSMARASQFPALVPRSKIQVMRYLFEHVGNSSHSRQQDVSDSGNNNYMSKLCSMRKPVPFIFFPDGFRIVWSRSRYRQQFFWTAYSSFHTTYIHSILSPCHQNYASPLHSMQRRRKPLMKVAENCKDKTWLGTRWHGRVTSSPMFDRSRMFL